MKMNFKIEGMAELEKSIKELGKVPQKHVTATARKAMNRVLSEARKTSPTDTGNLKKGMKLKGEKSKYKGKKVYEIVFNEDYNDIFQTKNKEGKVVGYYPVSQEYGFFTKDGKYIEGKVFVRGALETKAKEIEEVIVGDMKKRIDKEIAIRGLK